MKKLIKVLIPTKLRQSIRNAQFKQRWQGTKHECVFCGANLKEWDWRGMASEVIEELQIVPSGRRRVTCPFCQSYDRDRLLWLFLIRKLGIGQTPIKLLHIAPEATVGSKLQAMPNIEYLSGDLDPDLAMVKLDVTAINLPDESFDAILCNHVLEHIPDDRLAMSELLRVLKPGGRAVLQVPIALNLKTTIEDPSCDDEEERLRRFGQIDHFRVYARADYVSRLQSVGWLVEEVDFVRELSEAEIEKYRVSRDEIIFLCRKPS